MEYKAMFNVVPNFFCVLQHLHKIDFVISAVKNFLTLNVINILFSSFSPIIRIHEERELLAARYYFTVRPIIDPSATYSITA